jgi:hypothetical protein
MLSDLTESVRGPQHRRTSLLADSKHRGRCHHNPQSHSNNVVSMTRYRDFTTMPQLQMFKSGSKPVFPNEGSAKHCWSSLRNGKINKHFWNIAKILKDPSKYRGNFCPAVPAVIFVRHPLSLCFGFVFKGAGLLFYGFLHGKEVWKKLV